MINAENNSHGTLQLSELYEFRADILAYIRQAMPLHLRRVFDPEDVVQDVYYDAVDSVANFIPGPDTSPRKWIFGIARNRLHRLMRDQSAAKRAGKRFGESDLETGHLLLMLQELAVYERTPSQSAIGHEKAILIDRAISQLPNDYRNAITYRYLQGRTVRETAELLQRSERAIHMLCYRGLQELKIILEGVTL